MKFSWNCEIQFKLWISVQIVNFSLNCDFQSTLWISVEIVKFSRNCEGHPRFNQFLLELVWWEIGKSALANTDSLKEQMHQVKMASSRNEDCLGDEVRIAWVTQMPRYRSTGWSWKVVIGVRWSWDVEELNKLPPSPVHRQLSVLEGPKEKFPAF